jgi:hypothetical protein
MMKVGEEARVLAVLEEEEMRARDERRGTESLSRSSSGLGPIAQSDCSPTNNEMPNKGLVASMGDD